MDITKENLSLLSEALYQKEFKNLTDKELQFVVSKAVMANISDTWEASKNAHLSTRRACYFSAEFLVGRAIFNNLLCTDLTQKVKNDIDDLGRTFNALESSEDALLGNGGLGRLAACFLDSGATLKLPLDGYGIRYRFGLFKQKIENGFQTEQTYDWIKQGDPWSKPCDEDTVVVSFADSNVLAVPYDMPIIGYHANHISTLRLWQCEPVSQFDFKLFNNQQYDEALKQKNEAENISRTLYPNDSTESGKILRFKQEYFFCSASLQDIIKKYKAYHGDNYSEFSKFITIQLNDTHPVVSIPELIRLLMIDGVSFSKAFQIAGKVFNYTNHTIMGEALEKWDIKLIDKVSPQIGEIILLINEELNQQLKQMNVAKSNYPKMQLLQGTTVHMAYLACFVCSYINGVARLHTEILKDDVLNPWYQIYPNKFNNKTNGITQRRFLRLCNPQLSALITKLLSNDAWITDLSLLKNLEKFADDKDVLNQFIEIKHQNKTVLNEYLQKKQSETFDTNNIVDSQIKRLHEYKRQLLSALSIVELYFEIKDKTIKDFVPTTFIFSAKAAPGYARAKGIIKYINEIKKLIEKDKVVSKYLKIIFVSDYSVSDAEKIIPASDVSEQISTAGTEASGTGNMKFMLNGAVTIGTYDGANIEIVEKAGEENNYIFGATVEEINKNAKNYNPKKLYDNNQRLKRCLDTLIDGTVSDGGTGIFKELYDSILKGASWHKADNYYICLDFCDYVDTKIRLNNDYKDKYAFAKKCFLNMCNAGTFSADRTISEYANDIWHIKPLQKST